MLQKHRALFCWPHIDLPSKEKKYDPLEALGLIWPAHRAETLPHHYSKLQGEKTTRRGLLFLFTSFQTRVKTHKREALGAQEREKYYSHQTSPCMPEEKNVSVS